MDTMEQAQDPDVRAWNSIFVSDPDVGPDQDAGDGSPPVSDTSGTQAESAPRTDEAAASQASDPDPAQAQPAPSVPEATSAQPPAPNWDSPDNPYLADRQKVERFTQALIEAQRQQQYRQQQEAERQRIHALADGDEQLAGELERLMA